MEKETTALIACGIIAKETVATLGQSFLNKGHKLSSL
jgi:hypothetical protein